MGLSCSMSLKDATNIDRIVAAMEQIGTALQYVEDPLKSVKMCITALLLDSTAIQHVIEELNSDRDIRDASKPKCRLSPVMSESPSCACCSSYWSHAYVAIELVSL